MYIETSMSHKYNLVGMDVVICMNRGSNSIFHSFIHFKTWISSH